MSTRTPSPEPCTRKAGDFYGLVGETAIMHEVFERIERYARFPIPVLVLGESGTGKEIVARAIGQIYGSERAFVAINCASIPQTLLESELFGHEQGAFTGAVRRHRGIITQADGGILFLDEIAELALATQAKLLRALETGEYRPVGCDRTHRSHFRLLAATNRNLDELVARKRFRLDLLHRLGAARILLPPLRERREDVPALVARFLESYRTENGGVGPGRASRSAVALLSGQSWPGNVRELKNVVEAAATIAQGEVLEECHLAEFIPAVSRAASCGNRLPTLAELIQKAERDAILEALQRASGDRAHAAALLGISVATLYRRMAQSGAADSTAITPTGYRPGNHGFDAGADLIEVHRHGESER